MSAGYGIQLLCFVAGCWPANYLPLAALQPGLAALLLLLLLLLLRAMCNPGLQAHLHAQQRLSTKNATRSLIIFIRSIRNSPPPTRPTAIWLILSCSRCLVVRKQ
jgi:hypothetical protein